MQRWRLEGQKATAPERGCGATVPCAYRSRLAKAILAHSRHAAERIRCGPIDGGLFHSRTNDPFSRTLVVG